MTFLKTLLAIVLVSIISCKSKPYKKLTTENHPIQVQGHRGERGNLPENTIEAFLGALHQGVDVIELDVVISKDLKVVVSHEPYMSHVYMSKPSGEAILKAEEKTYNLFQMTYDSIKTFDSGSRGNKNFPEQKKLKTYKPLLSDVFTSIENEIKTKNLTSVKYNIEIKSSKNAYGIYQPQPEKFIDLVMQVINDFKMNDKVNIQSFDPKVLNLFHDKYPKTEIAYLVSKGYIKNNLKNLNFKPSIYSPNFNLIKDQATVDSLKTMNIKIIPWTVNNKNDIKKMIHLKVDGIITDYPNRVFPLLP